MERASRPRQLHPHRARIAPRDCTNATRIGGWWRRAPRALSWVAGLGAGVLIATPIPVLARSPTATLVALVAGSLVLLGVIATAVLLIEGVAPDYVCDDEGRVHLRVRGIPVALRPRRLPRRR